MSHIKHKLINRKFIFQNTNNLQTQYNNEFKLIINGNIS